MSLRFDNEVLDRQLAHYAPLPRAVARFVLARGGGWALAVLAAQACARDLDGHSELTIEPAEAAAIRTEPMVGTPEGFDPTRHALVVDGGRLKLARNFVHERDIATALSARLVPLSLAAPVSDADLAALFGGAPPPEAALQAEAVRRVVGRRLFVLTGGPGTGKTTTVVRMLAALAREHAVRHGGVAPRVRLAAPTGKAAQRLEASFEAERAAIAGRVGLPPEWARVLGQLADVTATTLHRLLGARGPVGGFTHGPGDPLPADVVVVDEASMVDLALMRTLIDALAPEATLVLVGDADQLTSIGTGSVLRDVVDALASAAPDAVVRLAHSFRADRVLAALNAAIRVGDASGFEKARAEAGEAIVLAPTASRVELGRRLVAWSADLAEALAAAGAFAPWDRNDMATATRVLSALADRQLLGVVREGNHGVVAANQRIGNALRERASSSNERWYPGRAVIVTRNDRASRLVNGDVGVVLHDPKGQPHVVFASGDSVRVVAPTALPDHESAFAITVHKSQGSEYGRVAVLLPTDPTHRLLSRQLLYTALTRARHAVEIWGSHSVIDAALARPVERATGLARRLMAPA
jgi:exodeoxyribonuclease V alpha subunit